MHTEDKHTLPVGTILNNKWIILEFIAKGGMGEIYQAHQLNLKRNVAIKIISRQWLDDIDEDQEEIENAMKRFRQEVQTMVQIRHPNVIQIYDYDTANVTIEGKTTSIEYIVLEYIPGMTLRGTMPEEGFYPDEKGNAAWLRQYFLPVLDGVAAIHGSGILHRDIKPENVLMDGEIPKIADFGIARSCRLESMTCSMEIKGTPTYMAPEQFTDFKRTDQRTDIYSLGKILYEAIEGKIPSNIVPFKSVRLKEAKTPFFQKLDRVIQKATAEDIRDRFQSVESMKEALSDALRLVHVPGEQSGQQSSASGRRPSTPFPRRIWLITLTLVVVIATAFGAGYWYFTYRASPHLTEHQETGTTPTDRLQATTPQAGHPDSRPRTIAAPDGVTLRLIPGGLLRLPPGFNGKKTTVVEVAPFYMDETQVTNHQFVNFLNQMLSKIRIEDGAVKVGNKIWLYLGEVAEGYEPIVFADGGFRVKNSSHSACPVVRVTAYGATAYAKFYHRHLPTKAEWLFAAMEGKSPESYLGRPPPLPRSFFKAVKLPFPVLLFKPNRLGIRGMNENIGEWVIDAVNLSEAGSGKSTKYAVMGGFAKDRASKHVLPKPVIRQPWEGFEEIGFRCVKDGIGL